MINPTDVPKWLLTIAVRRMPAERSDWGAAMLAELAQLQNPFTRWWFALGCARVALFPPRKGNLLQILRNNLMKNTFTTFGSASLISLVLVLPFAILESLHTTITRQNASGLIVLFGLLWLLPMAFIFILVPAMRTQREENAILTNPINLLIRIAFLAFIAMMWGSVVIDQLPCFLGYPNCD